MLRPLGGAICVGQPAQARTRTKPLAAAALRRWIAKADVKDAQIIETNGTWLKVTRGPLEGARDWTHQFANTGNTACSGDRLVKCPLGILWFGGPGPGKMVQRHRSAAAPLVVNGRAFVQGENVLMAYDAYNGLRLWEREIPGAIRIGLKRACSNLAASDNCFFVAVGDHCLRLAAATGETQATYALPPSQDGKPRTWGYVAVMGGLLFGSVAPTSTASDLIFATDIKSGKPVWVYPGKNISHTTIAMGDGCMFLADRSATPEEREEALKERISQLEQLKDAALSKAQKEIESAEVRVIVALDAATGETRWRKPVDVSNCMRISAGGGQLAVMLKSKVLVLCNAPWNGHNWKQFFAGDFARRSVIALSSEDGTRLWSRKVGYRSRPLVVGDTVVTEPWACDLRTGQPKKRVNPITGETEGWQFARPGHHCGWVSASASALFFRSWSTAWFDLIRDYGTSHFGAIRPGCCINIIPANGLVVIPEASSGCMCPFPNMCTIVLKPRRTDRTWGMFSARGPTSPVRHLAINLGAPGDRRDERDTLWVAYPRPSKHGIVLQLKLDTSILPECGYFQRSAEGSGIEGTPAPWVFASGCAGLAKCIVPLADKGQAPAAYTVRLAFSESVHERAGKRVFDIRLQDKVVLKGFDIFKEAGARNKAVVKEFTGVRAADSLKIELVPKTSEPTPEQAPVLNGFEVIRTPAVHVR